MRGGVRKNTGRELSIQGSIDCRISRYRIWIPRGLQPMADTVERGRSR